MSVPSSEGTEGGMVRGCERDQGAEARAGPSKQLKNGNQ